MWTSSSGARLKKKARKNVKGSSSGIRVPIGGKGTGKGHHGAAWNRGPTAWMGRYSSKSAEIGNKARSTYVCEDAANSSVPFRRHDGASTDHRLGSYFHDDKEQIDASSAMENICGGNFDGNFQNDKRNRPKSFNDSIDENNANPRHTGPLASIGNIMIGPHGNNRRNEKIQDPKLDLLPRNQKRKIHHENPADRSTQQIALPSIESIGGLIDSSKYTNVPKSQSVTSMHENAGQTTESLNLNVPFPVVQRSKAPVPQRIPKEDKENHGNVANLFEWESDTGENLCHSPVIHQSFFYDEESCDDPVDEEPQITAQCQRVLFIDNYQYKNAAANNENELDANSDEIERISKLLRVFRSSGHSKFGNNVAAGLYGVDPTSTDELKSIVDLLCRNRFHPVTVQALFAMVETRAVQWSSKTAAYAFTELSKAFTDYPRLVSRYKVLVELQSGSDCEI